MAQSYDGLLAQLSSYDLENLVPHLASQQRQDDLRRLLFLVEPTWEAQKVNSWYAARIATGHIEGYLADVRLAGRVAELQVVDQLMSGRAASALADVWRYALVETVIISTADNISPALLYRLVTDGIWPPAQALAFARRAPEPGPRAAALATMIRIGGPDAEAIANEAAAIARSIAHPLHRARAASALLTALDGHRRSMLLAENLDTIGQIDDEDWRSITIVVLAPVLTSEEAAAALPLLDDFHEEPSLASAAAALIDRMPDPLVSAAVANLPDSDKVTRAFAERPVAAQYDSQELMDYLSCGIDGWRLRALAASGIPLAAPLLEQCLAAAWSLADPVATAWTVAGLVRQVPDMNRQGQILLLLDHIERHRSDAEVVDALAPIEDLFTDDERHRAFAIAAEETNSLRGVRTLAVLARGIHEPLRGQTYTGMVHFLINQADEADAAETIAAITPYVPEEHLDLVIRSARRIRDPACAAMALWAVAQAVPPGWAEELVRAAAAAASKIEEEQPRAQALIELAPLLPADLAAEANAAASDFTDEALASEVRSALLPHLPAELLSHQFKAAMAEYARTRTTASPELSAIVRACRSAPLLPALTVSDLLTTAAQLIDPDERVAALAELLPHARAAGVQPSDDLVAYTSVGVSDPWQRPLSIARSAGCLPARWSDPMYENVVESVIPLVSAHEPVEGLRRRTLITVAEALPSKFQPRLLAIVPELPTDQGRERWTPDHVMLTGPSTAQSYAEELAPVWGERASVLAALAVNYPATRLAELATAAQHVGDVYQQAQVLLDLRGLLPHEDAEQLVFQTAQLLRSGNDSARAYCISKLLTGPGAIPLGEVLDAVLEIGNVGLRAHALAECARSTGSPDLLDAMDALPDPGWRAYAYCMSGLPLDSSRLTTACRDLWKLEGELDSYLALEAIAARLPDAMMREVLETVLALDDHRAVGVAVSDLASGMSESLASDAYRVARKLVAIAHRFAVIANVAPKLPASLLDTAVADLLQAPPGDPQEHAHRGLEGSAPRLSHQQRIDALTRVAALTEPLWRAEATIALLPGLLETELLGWSRNALSMTLSLEPGWHRDKLLASLIPALPASLRHDARQAIDTITDDHQRLAALRSVANHFPEPDRWKILAEVQHAKLQDARTADDDLRRRYAIIECIEANPEGVGTDLALALTRIAASINDPRERGPAIAACAPSLSQAAHEQPLAVWETIRPDTKDRRRADLLSDLRALLPVLQVLGGEAAAASITETVTYVIACWP